MRRHEERSGTDVRDGHDELLVPTSVAVVWSCFDLDLGVEEYKPLTSYGDHDRPMGFFDLPLTLPERFPTEQKRDARDKRE